jgi:hypothetical protein
MLSSSQLAVLQQRGNEILAAFASAGHDWIVQYAKPFRLPWGSPEQFGLAIDSGGNDVSSDKLARLKEQGWFAQVHEGRVILAPFVTAPLPPTVFHVTLAEKTAGIFTKGLCTGAAVDCSTSGRQDCTDYIYVSLDKETAREWAAKERLGNRHPGKEWALMRIDTRALAGQMFRDPASATAWILEDKNVPAGDVLLIERFWPGE